MPRIACWSLAALFVIALGNPVPASAIPEGWHTSLDDGLEAAKKSGKPLLVVTGWKSGI
jgi:hypothetical protein